MCIVRGEPFFLAHSAGRIFGHESSNRLHARFHDRQGDDSLRTHDKHAKRISPEKKFKIISSLADFELRTLLKE